MGHHDEQSQQHGMGQSGLEGSDKERDLLQQQEGSPSGGMTQGTTQVGTHGNEGYDETTALGQEGDARYNDQPRGAGYGQQGDPGMAGGGYGQDSGFDQSAGGGLGTGQPSGGDYGTGSTGSAEQGDMTRDPMGQDQSTRSGNTGWNDRSSNEEASGSDR